MEVEWDGIIASSLAIELLLIQKNILYQEYISSYGISMLFWLLFNYVFWKKVIEEKSTFGVYWKRIIPNRVPAD